MTKILEEELQQINTLRSKLATTVSEVGQLSLQVQLLEADIVELKNKITESSTTFKQLLIEEQEIIKRLSEKYGTGSINFETGEFTPE
jgi:regulator of replication initiation timing